MFSPLCSAPLSFSHGFFGGKSGWGKPFTDMTDGTCRVVFSSSMYRWCVMWGDLYLFFYIFAPSSLPWDFYILYTIILQRIRVIVVESNPGPWLEIHHGGFRFKIVSWFQKCKFAITKKIRTKSCGQETNYVSFYISSYLSAHIISL